MYADALVDGVVDGGEDGHLAFMVVMADVASVPRVSLALW